MISVRHIGAIIVALSIRMMTKNEEPRELSQRHVFAVIRVIGYLLARIEWLPWRLVVP